MNELKIVEKNGCKKYYVNDILHREDGPAVESSDGLNEWYLDGKFIGSQIRDGNHESYSYYINGEYFTESKFKTTVLKKYLEERIINKKSSNPLKI